MTRHLSDEPEVAEATPQRDTLRLQAVTAPPALTHPIATLTHQHIEFLKHRTQTHLHFLALQAAAAQVLQQTLQRLQSENTDQKISKPTPEQRAPQPALAAAPPMPLQPPAALRAQVSSDEHAVEGPLPKPTPTPPQGPAFDEAALQRMSQATAGANSDEAIFALEGAGGRPWPFHRVAGLQLDVERRRAAVWLETHAEPDPSEPLRPVGGVLGALPLAAGLLRRLGGAPGGLDGAARLTLHDLPPAPAETYTTELHVHLDEAGRAHLRGAVFVQHHPILSLEISADADAPRPPEPVPSGGIALRPDQLLEHALKRRALPVTRHRPPALPARHHLHALHVPTGAAPRTLQAEITLPPQAGLHDLLDAACQALGATLLATGATLDHDGWLMAPRVNTLTTLTALVDLPLPPNLTLHLHVLAFDAQRRPRVKVNALATAQGAPVAAIHNLSVALIPAWPLTPAHAHRLPIGAAVPLDPRLAALARPSVAFGEEYAAFDSARALPRPFHTPLANVARLAALDVPRADERPLPGATLSVGFDLTRLAQPVDPHDPSLPIPLLVDAAYWAALLLVDRAGFPLSTDLDLRARPLDANITLLNDAPAETRSLDANVRLRSSHNNRGELLLDFDVELIADHTPALAVELTLGLLPDVSLQHRALHAPTRPQLMEPLSKPIPLRHPSPEDFTNPSLLPDPQLLLVDRITAFDPNGGRAHLGRARAELNAGTIARAVERRALNDAHLPDSLGIQATLQALHCSAILKGLARNLPTPRLEPLAAGEPMSITARLADLDLRAPLAVDLEITEIHADAQGALIRAEAWLTCDQRVILHLQNAAARLVASRHVELRAEPTPRDATPSDVLDARHQPWLLDYCPTFTLPALPMLFVADQLAQAARRARPEDVVFKIERLVMTRWFALQHPLRLRPSIDLARGRRSALVASLLAKPAHLPDNDEDWETVATARLIMAPSFAPCREVLTPPQHPEPLDDPYVTTLTFHGPAFHLLERASFDATGGIGTLDPRRTTVPRGEIHPAVLEAALHLATPQALTRWCDEINPRLTAYPTKLDVASFHAPPPRDEPVEVQLQFEGFRGGPRFPAFTIHYRYNQKIWATLQLVCVLVPRPRLQALPPDARVAFTRHRRFVEGIGLSRFEGDATRIRLTDIQAADWLEGTVASLYNASGDHETLSRVVVVKDHFAQRLRVHPALIDVDLDRLVATSSTMPLKAFPFRTQREVMAFVTRSWGEPGIDTRPLLKRLRDQLVPPGALAEDLLRALITRLLGDVHAPPGVPLPERALFLTTPTFRSVPSLLHTLLPLLTVHPVSLYAPGDAIAPWVRWLHEQLAALPGARMSRLFAESTDVPPQGTSLLALLPTPGPLQESTLQATRRALRHALALNLPVVPVLLAAQRDPQADDFPAHLGRFNLAFGAPISPQTATVEVVADALHTVASQHPPTHTGGDPTLAQEAHAWSLARSVEHPFAVLFKLLQYLPDPGPHTSLFIQAAAHGRIDLPSDALGDWLATWIPRLLGPDIEIMRNP